MGASALCLNLLLQRLFQHFQVLLHNAEVGLAPLNVLRGDGLHRIQGEHVLILVLRVLDDGRRNLLIRSLNRHDVLKAELIHLLCEEGDGLKARLGLRRATHKGRIVLDAIVIHQIAEGEAIAEEQGLIARGIDRLLILLIQRIELALVLL